MGLDFSHTCPKIDKAISEAKDTIIDYLKDYITDLCPYITNEKANELSKDWGTDLYDKISDGFEATRETNEDMRKQADYQIEKLESEIDDLKSEIKELESQLDTVIESAFIELFDKAACIRHWHNTGKNDEGMIVSSDSVYELWEVLDKYRDLRHSL